ncbi:MAG TPA: hypothetical protein VGR84_15500 [Candidatus Acidoferrales bacterium]|nr:hypothetical protein [Candidatus Acidoferrales bacterium]
MPDTKLRISRIQSIGNSHGITLPVPFLRALGATKGDYLRLELHDKTITIRSINENAIPHRTAPRTTGPGKFLNRA